MAGPVIVPIFMPIYQTTGSPRMDVKFCRHQHQVLVMYIRYALQCWGPVDDHCVSYWMDDTVTPSKRYSLIQTTPELKRVLTRARVLSEDCCVESPPHKAVLRHADRSKAFADIVKEIQWCTSVVYNGSICKNVTRRSAPELKDFPWQAKIGYQENLLLEKAEHEDWRDLVQQHKIYMARPWVHRVWEWARLTRRLHNCSAEDCGNMHGLKGGIHCLAKCIFDRFKFQESDGSDLDNKSLLWSFDPEVVKHVRRLGSGSFGFVTEVSWLRFNYARKFFNIVEQDSLPAEAEALVKLNHPHIVKVYAYSEDSLLMDLMCMDLQKFMKKRMERGTRAYPFSLPATIDLMLQIADATSYIHSQNVAHRDLKSSNILVNPVNTPGLPDEDDGFVFAKIADFGLAKVTRDTTRYSHLTHNIGTKKWMAPEIFGANKKDDHQEHAFPMKADVYSFGIICFEILSGEEPFSGELLSTLYSKLTAPIPLRPQLPSSCPSNLASLIHTCWDADPQKRPAFEDVCQVLRYLKGLPTVIALSDVRPVPIDGEWPFGRLNSIVKKQGPWGGYRRSQKDGIHCTGETLDDIRGVQFLYNDVGERILSGFKILCINGGHRIERSTGGAFKSSSEWIYFQETEFLVQVEGSTTTTDVVSLSFITTRQKYQSSTLIPRYLNMRLFRSDHGRVVGFTAVSDNIYDDSLWALRVFEVHTIPNVIGCLQQYLGNKE